MRAPFLLLLALASAACGDSAAEPAPADPRTPVSMYLRTDAFIRADFVDSAFMASDSWPGMQARARARAQALWQRYATPGMDSIVVRVSNRPEAPLRDGVSRQTLFFPFTRAEMPAAAGDAAAPAAPSADGTRPLAIELHPGAFVRAEFVDSAAAASLAPPRDRMLALAQQTWRRFGTPEMDSVVVSVVDRAEREHRRVTTQFTRAEVQGQ